uniref:Uncharacterized protein n=1 Tax=Rhabditophanes sp. KR3021 TaxID=114890 RepID=A0AC35TWJ2_9BILA
MVFKICRRFALYAWLTALTAFVSLAVYALCMNKGLHGFQRQINAFIPLGTVDLSNFIMLSTIIGSIIILTFLISATLSSYKVSKNDSTTTQTFTCLTSYKFTGLFIYILYFMVGYWIIILAITAITMSMYILFIGIMYSFCSLLDQQCFDFKVFLPFLIEKFTNKKVDLTFCKEKKELICERSNNMSFMFICAFICCVVGVMALIQCLVILSGKSRQVKDLVKMKNAYQMIGLEGPKQKLMQTE